jgi:pimeloyl-ACP methyl ester carboxylesterase
MQSRGGLAHRGYGPRSSGARSPSYDATRRMAQGSPVRVWTVRYLAHNGLARNAYVVLPSAYGPRNNPPLPLIISPHGRGIPARSNVKLWGDLPARGNFAVINPDGHGRTLPLHSWGWRRQIDDLANMQYVAKATLPWLRVRPHGIYAFGGSMGGQETLLLMARFPRLLAGAAAFDSPTDLARRYRDFPRIPGGRHLQELARREIGGTPDNNPAGYALRSPINYVRALAFSRVPLQLYWSVADEVVVDQAYHSGRLYRRIRELNPNARVTAVTGSWTHSGGMVPMLRRALRQFGLLFD